MSKPSSGKRQKVLLSGVFGPFGVDDEYGRKENIMELFHNQVTKGQGVASFRFHHRSFGLNFIAENIDADVTVLDFPSKKRFEREVGKGYDIVGISFIAPNFSKAREMARITRRVSPAAEIVLGGHGAAIEGIEERIDCDHVVKGEGIGWMRAHLGQDPDAPIFHPALPSTQSQAMFGVPVPGPPAALLVPGVGCVNACKFCSTSHFFGKRYTPYLGTGQELFDTCERVSEEIGTDEFFVMDENFLKNRERARELLELTERHQRFFRFNIFSSAEAVTAFGVDNMVRLGVKFVWIGVESSSHQGNFEKNRGIDPKALITELRSKGIIVLASGILCQEHHSEETVQQEIDFMVDLQADFVQFMLLTPLPVTALYASQKKRGLLREDLPFEEWHGQKQLSYEHPAFPGRASERWIERAFAADYQENSSSMYRVIETTYRGWTRLARLERDGELDACLRARKKQLHKQLWVWSCMLTTVARNPANEKERSRAKQLDQKITADMSLEPLQRVIRAIVPAATAAWKLRVKLRGDAIQPATILTRYDGSRNRHATQPLAEVMELPKCSECPSHDHAVAAMVASS